MLELQSAGVPAAAVNRIGELLEEPQLGARGFWQIVERPFSGPRPVPCAPYRFGEPPLAVLRPAPTLGQHNRDVLLGLLGLTEAELEQLERDGVIGTQPA
jgi:crotonobetainyl-CoA:carnitine CoA-transferase CaiB-like acyl-CoA transferase